MTVNVIFENEHGTVRFDTKGHYVYHTFHGPIGGKPFQEILNTGLDTLAANKAIKWLSDDRKNAEFSPEDVEFAVADWGPRAAAAGWKFWALVVPEDIAARASMQDIVTVFYQLGVRVMIFTDVPSAQEWLLKQG